MPAGSSESEARAALVANTDQSRSAGGQARDEALSVKRWRALAKH